MWIAAARCSPTVCSASVEGRRSGPVPGMRSRRTPTGAEPVVRAISTFRSGAASASVAGASGATSEISCPETPPVSAGWTMTVASAAPVVSTTARSAAWITASTSSSPWMATRDGGHDREVTVLLQDLALGPLEVEEQDGTERDGRACGDGCRDEVGRQTLERRVDHGQPNDLEQDEEDDRRDDADQPKASQVRGIAQVVHVPFPGRTPDPSGGCLSRVSRSVDRGGRVAWPAGTGPLGIDPARRSRMRGRMDGHARLTGTTAGPIAPDQGGGAA